MTSTDGDPGGAWPDRDGYVRWRRALIAVAERLRDERGVVDPWRLTVGWGALWVEYGDLRIRVADDAAELRGPEHLFDEIDSWVASDRTAGPGRVLERDERAMVAWRERLPAVRQFWEDVAGRVFRDVEATTDLRLEWRAVVDEDELIWPAMPHGAVGGIVPVDQPPLARRSQDFPQVWLHTAHTGWCLPEMTDVAAAIGYLADLVQEEIMEEVHGAWPQCPRHPHPLGVHLTDSARAVWRCPDTPTITVLIGELGESGALPV